MVPVLVLETLCLRKPFSHGQNWTVGHPSQPRDSLISCFIRHDPPDKLNIPLVPCTVITILSFFKEVWFPLKAQVPREKNVFELQM